MHPKAASLLALLCLSFSLSSLSVASEKSLKKTAGVNPVTFSVDMAIQILEEKFSPDSDTLSVIGDFNAWLFGATLLADADGDSVYKAVVEFPDSVVNTETRFLFAYRNGGSEVREGEPKRRFVIPPGGGAVPVDFFDRDEEFNSPYEQKTAQVTFTADLAGQMAQGVFLPEDSLFVAGDFNGWNGRDNVLQRDPNSPTLYRLQRQITAVPGDTLRYRYAMQITGLPGFDDRSGRRWFVFSGEDQELAPDLPDFADSRPLLAAETRRFEVNIKPLYRKIAARGYVLGIFSTRDTVRTVQAIHIVGEEPLFNGWRWGEIDTRWQLYDDGSHGDRVAGDSIFTALMNFPPGLPSRGVYKYAVNGIDAESGFGRTRLLLLDGAARDSVQYDVWGSEDDLFAQYTRQHDYTTAERPDPVTVRVVFSADLAEQMGRGVFQPQDTLLIAGNFSGTGSRMIRLERDRYNPVLYRLIGDVTAVPGDTVRYQYVVRFAGGGGMAEQGRKRWFVFTGSSRYLSTDVPFFALARPLRQAVTRRFEVNVRPLYRRLAREGYVVDIQTRQTIASVNTIHIVGPEPPFNGWRWRSISNAWRLYDDGTHGDRTPGDSVFTATLVFPPGAPSRSEYKYAVNGYDAESGFGQTHFLVLDENSPEGVISDVWGSTGQLYSGYIHSGDFTTGVDGESQRLPRTFSLEQNFPNPFNPETAIAFSVPQAAPVRLVVFDLHGREVRRLTDTVLQPGRYRLRWDGRDASGAAAASGVYFYQLRSGSHIITRKMTLLR